ncbi:E1A-binding protein p400 [Frankliniella fusca]|uniref:E1A-binding protein p400 n=1 Tax=Frankliniella fusca TaxID=407009 RepID=A0AAE1LQX9_9NEOP|nr:E1A-binding protein p400 [Frankliniella fusca]
MLPLYAADWFLGVVAMDNSTTLAYPLLFLVTNGFLNWFLMVCAWLIVPRECKEPGDWCGAAEGEDLDDEEEYLMEEDDAGCWGKGSFPSASLLSNHHGHHDVYAPAYSAEVILWGGEDATQSAINVSFNGGGRWDEAGSPALMREVELASPTAPVPSPGQELAEMRYDGGISTITT